MEPTWLDWARRLYALAQTGLTFAESPYDIERYEAIRTIAAEIEQAAPGLIPQFEPIMRKISANHDWQEYGGAPLLGVDGYCLICHGRSEARAIKNAIRVAKQLTNSRINEKIVQAIESSIPVAEE